MENTPTGRADDLPTFLGIFKNDPKRSVNNSLQRLDLDPQSTVFVVYQPKLRPGVIPSPKVSDTVVEPYNAVLSRADAACCSDYSCSALGVRCSELLNDCPSAVPGTRYTSSHTSLLIVNNDKKRSVSTKTSYLCHSHTVKPNMMSYVIILILMNSSEQFLFTTKRFTQ